MKLKKFYCLNTEAMIHILKHHTYETAYKTFKWARLGVVRLENWKTIIADGCGFHLQVKPVTSSSAHAAKNSKRCKLIQLKVLLFSTMASLGFITVDLNVYNFLQEI